ncbi:hypothetical protein A8U91_01019 [Halomonas elongata]|uniref:Uncharacterized protein n=1 Tax=Halomonas elongata TaxID=2746 RepID=A0A1B8P325_HALEL|nr:hypothetical protein A8U91_01019 [Halomonas elongata]
MMNPVLTRLAAAAAGTLMAFSAAQADDSPVVVASKIDTRARCSGN